MFGIFGARKGAQQLPRGVQHYGEERYGFGPVHGCSAACESSGLELRMFPHTWSPVKNRVTSQNDRRPCGRSDKQ